MLVNKAYKFRIYPNREQEVLIAKTIGCSRFVFNHFLAKWNDTYKETGKGLTYNICSSQLTQLKKELNWLKEVDSISLQSSLKNSLIHIHDSLKSRTKPHVSNRKRIKFNLIQQNIRMEILPLQETESSYLNLDS